MLPKWLILIGVDGAQQIGTAVFESLFNSSSHAAVNSSRFHNQKNSAENLGKRIALAQLISLGQIKYDELKFALKFVKQIDDMIDVVIRTKLLATVPRGKNAQSVNCGGL